MQKIIWGVLLSLGFGGCSQMHMGRVTPLILDKTKTCAVAPFYNYTQTPLAGHRAASLTNAIAATRGFNCLVIDMKPSDDLVEDNSKKRETYIALARKKGADYLLTGDVLEWRYKSGVDGEPAVGLVLMAIDTRTSKSIYTDSASKSGWGSSSIGVVAQDLLQELIK